MAMRWWSFGARRVLGSPEGDHKRKREGMFSGPTAIPGVVGMGDGSGDLVGVRGSAVLPGDVNCTKREGDRGRWQPKG